MLSAFDEATVAAAIGAFGGILLGLAARLGRFCSLGAIEDYFYGGSTLRMRMWGVAIGLSIFGSFALMGLGQFDETRSIYLATAWSPAASILGGLVFGYGMALAGNCGFGALARLGGGDLRSMVIVIVMGLSAYVTIAGPLAPLRQQLLATASSSGTPDGIAHHLANGLGTSVVAIGLTIGVMLVILSLTSAAFRQERGMILASVAVAGAIISAWWGTSYLAETGFDATPVVSHTFTAPVGESILYLMTSTGSSVSFGVGSVGGVIFGAFLGSLVKGHFRWEACEDPRELRRQILGAVLMGIGAVVSLGCTVGQGLSAFSVLAISAPVTMMAIVAGASLGLRQLIMGFGVSE